MNIPADGIYEFWLESKDGALLTIGDEILVDLDGVHANKISSGEIPLSKGFHLFNLKYFQTAGHMNLSLHFGLKGQPPRGFGNFLFYKRSG